MTRDELLERLAGLRQARVGQVRVPHKPLLLLWLFGQFAATGTSAATYRQAEPPVSRLINDFGPPVASPAAARQRAAMPFVHLERDLWDLRDATGTEIAPKTLAAAARLLLDLHFTPVLADLICAAADLDVPALGLAGTGGAAYRLRSLLGFQPFLAPELGYGKAVLTEYEDDLRRVWETERPFELHLPTAIITGRADVILDKEGGEIESLAIVRRLRGRDFGARPGYPCRRCDMRRLCRWDPAARTSTAPGRAS